MQYIAAKYGSDIANELQNQTKVVINPPEYSTHILARHNAQVSIICAQQMNMLSAYWAKLAAIEQNITSNPSNADLLTDLVNVNNNIIQLEFEMSQEVDVLLSEKEKSEYCLDGKTYTDHVNKLSMHREQVFGLIMGQCMQLLQDKMKQDAQWMMVS